MLGKEMIKQTDDKMKKAVEAAKREFNEVRTGRAHPGLIEGLHIDYCGTHMTVKQIASISIPDPRTVLIQPWDPGVIPEIEKSVNSSTLGATCSNDGKVVRLNIPALSEERRNEMKKVVKDMAEKSRVSLRSIRREINDKMKKMETVDKSMTEDEYYRSHEEIQKITDRYIKEIDELLEQKSKSLME
ncbi:MAG: ribosome recycling factor [Candidatus Omnitrophica bacterium]|nr:ribosome recycling factor [Candidatus Omnitrophota bacterium]